MALIKCKECGTDVSSKAETCPKCGVRIARKPMGCGTLLGVLFFGAIIISTFSTFLSPDKEGSTSKRSTSASSAGNTQSVVKPASKLPGSQWKYWQRHDDMTNGNIYRAYVASSNTVNFDFPYSGEQHATLSLRTHPRYGKDIIFNIEKGQILCHSYEDCTVLVRFDDGAPSNYSAVGAADNSTETIFIRNYSKFVGKMLKAKKVRIAVNIYQEGSPVFEFDVSGFEQSKYKPQK